MNNAQILWTSAEAELITGGHSTDMWLATGLCLNMQELGPGDLFFASPEDDLNLVFQKGAAAAVVPHGAAVRPGMPVLKVPDVFEALRHLAAAARFRTHGLVLAVQGRREREAMAGALSRVASVHACGRHMSLGQAAMPEICDYGIFGFSPHVRPDIAVVTDGAAALNSTIFESMPDNGILLVGSDDPEFLTVMARARHAGIRNIHCFGRRTGSDCTLEEFIQGQTGTRMSLSVLGESFPVLLPAGVQYCQAYLASLLILKLSGISPARYASRMAACLEAAPAGRNVSLLGAHPDTPPEAAFRVQNMIDLGRGRRTLILDKFMHSASGAQLVPGANLAVPGRIDSMNVLYAGKGLSLFKDARSGIQKSRAAARLEKIVPDVLAPGDFVVFRNIWESSRAVFCEALRLVPEAGKRKGNPDHAV